MDGKLAYVKTLSLAETSKIFRSLLQDHDQYISVRSTKIELEPVNEAQMVSRNFEMMRNARK